jgi:hypothetical protein
MPGVLLYRFDGTDGEIRERLDERYPAVQVEQQQFFDGVNLYFGQLADKRYTEQQVARGNGDAIVSEQDEVVEYVDGQYLVAPTAGLAGISTSSAGGLLRDILLQDLGAPPREASVDLESFVDAEVESHRADVWAVSYSDGDREEGIPPSRAGARYHNDARLSDVDSGDVSLLGVTHMWEGRSVQALVCESGWVAAHEDDLTTSAFARWVHDSVGPHLLDPVTEQTTLGEGSE